MTTMTTRPLPDRDRLRAARALHLWWGVDRLTLARMGFTFRQEYLSSPAFDPIDDEVAVERAIAGERAVYEALTHYERARVREVVHTLYKAGELDLHEWSAKVGETSNNMSAFIYRLKKRVARG